MIDNTEAQDKNIPSSLIFSGKLEIGVLTCILNNNNNFFSVGKMLSEGLFYDTKNKNLFRMIRKGISDGKTVDLMYVVAETAKSTAKGIYTVPDLMGIFTGYISDALFGQYVEELVELSRRRSLWALGQKLIRLGVDMTYSYNDAMKEIESVMEKDGDTDTGVISLKDANTKMMQRVRDNITGVSDSFIPTGFSYIDSRGGFQTSDFNVIAAATSSGKTSLATSIAVNAAKAGKPVMCYSMEMMAEQIAARINATISKVSSSLIQYKKLYESQFNDVQKAVNETNDLPIYFDDSSTTSAEAIFTSMRASSKKYGIKVFIIDYLQILSSIKSVSDQQSFLGEVSRKLKNLAKELNVNVTVLSQLARNNQDPMPTLDRLRASGQIAEASDTVLLIWRPSLYGKTSYKDSYAPVEGTAQIIIAKGRNIGTGSFIAGFDADTTNFYDFPEEQLQSWAKSGKPKEDGEWKRKDGKDDMPLGIQVRGNTAKEQELPF